MGMLGGKLVDYRVDVSWCVMSSAKCVLAGAFGCVSLAWREARPKFMVRVLSLLLKVTAMHAGHAGRVQHDAHDA